MMNIRDIFTPFVYALIILFIQWLFMRINNSGKPLTRFQNLILPYLFWFVLGMGYIFMITRKLEIFGTPSIILTIGWLCIIIIAFIRNKIKL